MLEEADGSHTGFQSGAKPNSKNVNVVVPPTEGVGVDNKILSGILPKVTSRSSPSSKICLFKAVLPYSRSANHDQKILAEKSFDCPPMLSKKRSSPYADQSESTPDALMAQ